MLRISNTHTLIMNTETLDHGIEELYIISDVLPNTYDRPQGH